MTRECFRQKIFKYGRILLIVLFTVLLMCQPVCVQAKGSKQVEEQQNHEVLFISSYSYTWFTVPLQLEGIQSALDSCVTLDTEFMDTKIIRSDMAEQILLEKIRFKQQNGWSYDAVIVGDDAALVFAMKSIGRSCSRTFLLYLKELITLNMPVK